MLVSLWEHVNRLPDWEFVAVFIVSMWIVQCLVFYLLFVSMWGK